MPVKRERYTPNDVGPIPLDWDTPLLNDVSSLITNGFVGTATPYYTGSEGVEYLYGTNVRENFIDLKNIRFITTEFHKQESKTELRTGDLLTVQSGHIGTTAVVPTELDGANCHALIVTRLHKDKVNSNFLSYYMNSHIGRARMRGLEVGSTIFHINTKDLKKFRVILPPISEQQKIAQILSTWDKAIEKLEALIAAKKKRKKALMQQLLTGKRRFSGYSVEWKTRYLGDVCSFKGGSGFNENYQGKTKGEIPFIKVSDMNLPNNTVFINDANNWVSTEVAKAIKAKPFPKGTIVFAKVGAALLLNRRRILMHETIIDNNMMAAVPNKHTETAFLYQLMLMVDFAKIFQDGAVPSINQSDLSRFKIKLPEIREQQKIATVLSAADNEITTQQNQLTALKQQKTGLMQRLLTGKKRVKVDQVAA